MVWVVMVYLDIDTLKFISAPGPLEGRAEMAMAMPRRPCARHWYGVSDAVSFVTQCTKRRAAGVSFQLHRAFSL